MNRRQPIQPLEKDSHGTLRFRENKIVNYLLKAGGIDMNKLADIDFPQEDREQFAELIGYSLSGFSELSYVPDETYAAASAMKYSGKDEKDARIETMTETLESLRKGLREPIAELFGIHPSDLGR
jgi:hypothetical protein